MTIIILVCAPTGAARASLNTVYTLSGELMNRAEQILHKLGVGIPEVKFEPLQNGHEQMRAELRHHDQTTRALSRALLTTEAESERANFERLLESGAGEDLAEFLDAEESWLAEIRQELDPLGLNAILADQRKENFLRSFIEVAPPTRIPRRNVETRELRMIWGIHVILTDRIQSLKRHFAPYFTTLAECDAALGHQRLKPPDKEN